MPRHTGIPEEIPLVMPGLSSKVAPREELLLRPVVLGQVVDETVGPFVLGQATPRAQITLIFARGWTATGGRIGVKLYENGVATGAAALFPPGVPVEFSTMAVRNAGTFAGRLLTRYRNADTNALLQELTSFNEINPGSSVDQCIAAFAGCTPSTIIMPDASLSIKIEAGHL